MSIRYNVIATGSTGNCVIIEDVLMIDLGVSFSKIKKYIDKVKVILLTHRHQDHIKPKTLDKILSDYKIKVYCIQDVYDYYAKGLKINDIKVVDDKKVKLHLDNIKMEFKAINTFHNVPNVAWDILLNNKKIIYATDTNRVDHIEAKHYDAYFIEANYLTCEALDELEQQKALGQYTHKADAMKNHLSFEKFQDFIEKNAKAPCLVVPLHMSNGGE